MIRLGFIDYFLEEWHANNYPDWLRRQAEALAYGGAPGRSAPIALERPGPAGGSALLDWDRAVERDARRYDGPFPLY